MKNPLLKRIPRELTSDIVKYILIFLFMTISIGFISGFLVASKSMIYAYDHSFKKYNVEDGNFEINTEADTNFVSQLKEQGITIYENFYYEQNADTDTESDSTLRIFQLRKDVNLVCLMEGELPDSTDEIAIDRMYAENNNLEVGSILKVDGYDYKISGLVALPDYSALFSDNNDTMFDAVLFGVAVVTEDRFQMFDRSGIHDSYSWKYDEEPSDETEEKEMADALMEVLYQHGGLENFIPRYMNQAINFTGNDMGHDKSMMVTLLYIVICILAFIFAVTTNNTILKEAGTIGTLRASGYTRKELLVHYMGLPTIVTLLAAIVGNICGYTFFKDVAAGMYYGSYSLTTYVTKWHAEAFLLTTIVPLILMFVINLLIISSKLRLSPLKFIRHDLGRARRKKAVRLPEFSFFNRFRIRIILQNLPSYLMLLIGISFANVLLMFGIMMSPLLKHFEDETINNMIAKYQYILASPAETQEETAEKYCVSQLVQSKEGKEEEITVYGIEQDSRYLKGSLPEHGVLISDGYAEKYKLKTGDRIVLQEEYGEKTYEFDVAGIFTYPSAMSVFMSDTAFREVFDVDPDYYSGYFSDVELTDLDETAIATTITKEDLTKVSRQLNHSMGSIFYLFSVFAIALFMIVIYLLTKLIIEKNTVPISIVKIMGYENGEIHRLYISATTIMVLIATILSIPISKKVIEMLYFLIMKDFVNGWLIIYFHPLIYPAMFVLCMLVYTVVACTQMKRIRKIPMDEALKNVE